MYINLPSWSILKRITQLVFNIIYLSETYLDSNTSTNGSNLEIPGYNLVYSVCIYHKNDLPLRLTDIVESGLTGQGVLLKSEHFKCKPH